MQYREAWETLTTADRERVVAYWQHHLPALAGDGRDLPAAIGSALATADPSLAAHLEDRFPPDLLPLLSLPLTLAELHIALRELMPEKPPFAGLREMVEGGLLFLVESPDQGILAVVPQEVLAFCRHRCLRLPPVRSRPDLPGKQEAHASRVGRHLLRFLVRMLREEEIRLTREGFVPKRMVDRWSSDLDLDLDVAGWMVAAGDPERTPPAMQVAYGYWRQQGVVLEDESRRIVFDLGALARFLRRGPGPMLGRLIVNHFRANAVPSLFWGIPFLAGGAAEPVWREWDWQPLLPRAEEYPPEAFRAMEREQVLRFLLQLELVEALREEERILFRLTDLGRLVLGGEEGRAATTAKVHPNFEVVLPPLASLPLLFATELLSEVRQDEAVAVYEIAEKPVEALLRQGVPEEELLAMVHTVYGQPPETVTIALRRWARRHKRVRLLSGTFLKAPDAETAAAIRSLDVAAEEPAEGLFWLDPGKLAAIKNRLKRLHVAVPARIESLETGAAEAPLSGLGGFLTAPPYRPGTAHLPGRAPAAGEPPTSLEGWRDVVEAALLDGTVLQVFYVFSGRMRIVPITILSGRDGSAYLQYYRVEKDRIRGSSETAPLSYLRLLGDR